MFSAGLVFVALLLVGGAALVTVSVTLAFGGLFDEARILDVGQSVLPQLGYVVLALYALWAAGVMVAAATVSARRSASFPRWLRRLCRRRRADRSTPGRLRHRPTARLWHGSGAR